MKRITFEIRQIENGWLISGNAEWFEGVGIHSRGLMKETFIKTSAEIGQIIEKAIVKLYESE